MRFKKAPDPGGGQDGRVEAARADAVVLASGGFQANPEWRTRYLGPDWELAKVRGTRFNTGDGIRMSLEIGAASFGNWSGCHAVGWEFNAPEFGDLAVGDSFQKHSYPWGVMVNATRRRFVDEGADFRNYTCARYGRTILEQPDGFAWHVFDAKVSHLLRDEYRIRQVTRVAADRLEELAARPGGVDGDGFLAEMSAYNDAVDTGTRFDPTVKDGRGTRGLEIPKSNWAKTISEPPFEAHQRLVAASPSRSAAFALIRRAGGCWTPISPRFRDSSRPENGSAGYSGSTIPVDGG